MRPSPQSPPIIETAVDREPWSAGLTRITWLQLQVWVGIDQPKTELQRFSNYFYYSYSTFLFLFHGIIS